MQLDSVDYSPIDHINGLFPTSGSLKYIQDVTNYVELYRNNLVLQNVRETIPTDEYDNIVKLCDKASEINEEIIQLKQTAESTDKEIKSMTSDIKRLDCTKNNLIQSITVLKRLQMLTNAYSQLSHLAAKRNYREISQTIPAVLELMEHFRQFRSISQIAQLSKQIADVETRLVEQIERDFAQAIERKGGAGAGGVAGGPTSSQLIDGCRVLESLGGNEKERLISWFCTVKLKEYRKIFSSGDEAGSLENISRRYAYLKRTLKAHEEEEPRLFPSEWKVASKLVSRFCQDTRDDINVTLAGYAKGSTGTGNAGSSITSGVSGGNASNETLDIQLLLSALKETIDFEQYLNQRIKTKEFTGMISGAFQQHLGLWIQHQDRILTSKFHQYRTENIKDIKTTESPNIDLGGNTSTAVANQGANEAISLQVMPSSADLFLFYRQILTQTARLSTGKPLLELSRLFGKWLTAYCKQVLYNQVPEQINTEWDVEKMSVILNTADYCLSTTNQLEQKLVDTIDADFKDKVDFGKESSQFLELVNLCIFKLVSRIETGSEYAWREMANTNWSKLDSVGDQSGYVAELCQSLARETEFVLSKIGKEMYCRMIRDKVVDRTMISYLNTMIRCRPISEVAAEQMLLDIYVIKECFLKLARLGAQSQRRQEQPDSVQPEQPSNIYVRHVSKSLLPTETILKVILTQSQPPEGLVQNYFYLVADRSAANFAKILELKGISRSSQTRFLELFNSHLKAHDNLIEESPILSNVQVRSAVAVKPAGQPHASTIKEGFERFTHGADAPVNKLNENFRNFGRLFRRDGASTPTFR